MKEVFVDSLGIGWINRIFDLRSLSGGALMLLLFLFFSSPSSASETFERTTIETLMGMSLEELIEVEITVATLTPQSVRKAPAIASVITAREIRNMGARNLTDVLKMVPGFGISKSEGPEYMLEVRGIRTLHSEKVLVMMNGHPLNRNFLGSAMRYHFNDLPVENIKQVEIIRGPGSALYAPTPLWR
jgi:outer membrane receptor for ferrienterochelin and colicin